MQRIDANEVKTNLSKLLERVAEGRRITITKHGVPVALLQPYNLERSVDVENVITQMRDFRENNTLDGLSIRTMVEEGRR